MATSNIHATFKCDIKKVWDIITSLKDYSWRSDLEKIEVLREEAATSIHSRLEKGFGGTPMKTLAQ